MEQYFRPIDEEKFNVTLPNLLLQLYHHVTANVNINNLVSIDLTSLFDVKHFRLAINLRHLTISSAMVENWIINLCIKIQSNALVGF